MRGRSGSDSGFNPAILVYCSMPPPLSAQLKVLTPCIFILPIALADGVGCGLLCCSLCLRCLA